MLERPKFENRNPKIAASFDFRLLLTDGHGQRTKDE